MPSAPFGIEMGSPLSSLSIVQELGQGKYFVTAAKPHPRFSTYIVQATPSHGVVWIKGLGVELPNDAYGDAVRAEVDKLIGQLEGRYGPGKKADMLFHDSIWEEPRDWSMALYQNERLYHCIWQKGESPGLPDDLNSIFVGASAIDTTATNAVLEYSSDRLDAAQAELDAADADLL